MSRVYLDTNILYTYVRDTGSARASAWHAEVLEVVFDGVGVISPLVVDELACRLVLAWLRDDGSPDPLSDYRRGSGEITRRMRSRLESLWSAINELGLEFAYTTESVVESARQLMVDPGLSPRDAFHAAHAIEARCDLIASVDADFDRLTSPRRLAPRD